MNYLKTSLQKNHSEMHLPSGAILRFDRPLVMSIINCTPDSFYPQSRSTSSEEAAQRALKAQSEGADIIDFGAESTRPGAAAIDQTEEIKRLIPALRCFRRQSSLPVSVDTSKAAVASAALDEGADIVNDVSALQDPGMLPLCAERKAAVVLMHNGTPVNSGDVWTFLLNTAEKAINGGIEKNKIILDPGFGFGKSTKDNLLLLHDLEMISIQDYPLLVGLSRKRFIGEISGRDIEGRLSGTIAANAFALIGGADIIRVHDTAESADLIKMLDALRKAKLEKQNDLVS